MHPFDYYWNYINNQQINDKHSNITTITLLQTTSTTKTADSPCMSRFVDATSRGFILGFAWTLVNPTLEFRPSPWPGMYLISNNLPIALARNIRVFVLAHGAFVFASCFTMSLYGNNNNNNKKSSSNSSWPSMLLGGILTGTLISAPTRSPTIIGLSAFCTGTSSAIFSLIWDKIYDE
jgi:hypothetical protein